MACLLCSTTRRWTWSSFVCISISWSGVFGTRMHFMREKSETCVIIFMGIEWTWRLRHHSRKPQMKRNEKVSTMNMDKCVSVVCRLSMSSIQHDKQRAGTVKRTFTYIFAETFSCYLFGFFVWQTPFPLGFGLHVNQERHMNNNRFVSTYANDI